MTVSFFGIDPHSKQPYTKHGGSSFICAKSGDGIKYHMLCPCIATVLKAVSFGIACV